MTCVICNTDKTNIEPKTDNFPICVDCVDDKVKEIATRKAQPEMIKSTTHRTRDDTPQQLRPDTRCEHCLANVAHTQWAHEDGIEDYLEREERIEKAIKPYKAPRTVYHRIYDKLQPIMTLLSNADSVTMVSKGFMDLHIDKLSTTNDGAIPVYQQVYIERDCQKMVNVKLKNQLNRFLNTWLGNLKKQGFFKVV